MASTLHVSSAVVTIPSFDDAVVPHLPAGYRLARWLVRDDHEAEDVVQEASLRAWRYYRTFDGNDGRAWFLRIVRNLCYTRRRAAAGPIDAFDEEQHSPIADDGDPERRLLRRDDRGLVERALQRLPERARRLLVLREVEGLSYRELAERLRVPIGTVMSRLSRARGALKHALSVEDQHDRFIDESSKRNHDHATCTN